MKCKQRHTSQDNTVWYNIIFRYIYIYVNTILSDLSILKIELHLVSLSYLPTCQLLSGISCCGNTCCHPARSLDCSPTRCRPARNQRQPWSLPGLLARPLGRSYSDPRARLVQRHHNRNGSSWCLGYLGCLGSLRQSPIGRKSSCQSRVSHKPTANMSLLGLLPWHGYPWPMAPRLKNAVWWNRSVMVCVSMSCQALRPGLMPRNIGWEVDQKLKNEL